ncbi:OsmC family protein [Alkalibaculum sporogenes]|uniref:OsmC family protein n=1 Tax=Alkalibaculum sporogenes TaxID=2655001 RepID=UPI0031B5A1DE
MEYLLAAFSGCLNVVCHVVAKEMGIELNALEIDIQANLNPNNFMGKSDKERSGFKEITVFIKPETSADEILLSKWLKTVENRCPVSDNIMNITPVKIELA